MASPNDLVVFQNVPLPTSATVGQTLTICEPSVANNGSQIYFSGNLFAARSLDNAATWTFLSPFTTFPWADGGFCCDQTLVYAPSHDLTIWFLQYSPRGNKNTLRLAVKKGKGGAPFDHYFDLVPEKVNSAFKNEWFDYNHAALSNKFLYVTTNTYTDEKWKRAVIFRIPLSALTASSSKLDYSYFPWDRNESLRCTAGARDVMYFAAHNSLSQIRLFTWPESSPDVSFNDISVRPWIRGGAKAPGPDGKDWLGRAKGDITGGYFSKGTLGFLWSANAQPPARPQPYVRAVQIDATTKAVINEPDIWNDSFAFAFPDAISNTDGDVGITLYRGGGKVYPTHVVGMWDAAANRWQLADTKASTNGPADTKWGDYIAVRRHAPDGLTFIASGFTLQGGGTQANIEPHYVHFGLRKHAEEAAKGLEP